MGTIFVKPPTTPQMTITSRLENLWLNDVEFNIDEYKNVTLEIFQDSVKEARTNVKNVCFHKFILLKKITDNLNLNMPYDISQIIINNLFCKTYIKLNIEKAIKDVEIALIQEEEDFN